MIEKIVRTYLHTELDIPVYIGEKPLNKPDEYVIIETIDYGRTDFIDAVTLDIFSYSTSMQKAAELNQAVMRTMSNIIEVPTISAAKLAGGGQNIDRQTKEYAYECIFNVYY